MIAITANINTIIDNKIETDTIDHNNHTTTGNNINTKHTQTLSGLPLIFRVL